MGEQVGKVGEQVGGKVGERVVKWENRWENGYAEKKMREGCSRCLSAYPLIRCLARLFAYSLRC